MLREHEPFDVPEVEPLRLLSIAEAPGLFADAVLADDGSTLLFLSLWGRDTAVQEFLARLSLPAREGGFEDFRLSDPGGFVRVGNADRLRKDSGRVPSSIFGPLVHLWLYDDLAAAPDRANRRALHFHRPSDLACETARDALRERLWALVRETCHLPLLPHWRDAVLGVFETEGWVRRLDGFGIHAIAIDLGSEAVDATVSELITSGRLDVVRRVPRDGRSTEAQFTRLELDLAPGDAGESVVTTMHPGEE